MPENQTMCNCVFTSDEYSGHGVMKCHLDRDDDEEEKERTEILKASQKKKKNRCATDNLLTST